MATYTKVTNASGNVRYRSGNQFVAADDVPASAKKGLEDLSDGQVVDELGDPVETYKGKPIATDEGSEDEAMPTKQDTTDDTSTADEDDEEDDTEEEAPAKPAAKPAARRKAKPAFEEDTEEGMGFPRVDGKTVDIFDGKTPHTHVKNVGGFIVPLSEESFNTKTDTEILEKLKELGKIS